jgi:hypothetical protein
MTISESLDALYEEAKNVGISLKSANIFDDEDLQVFALNFLRSNLEDAFEGLREGESD